MRRALILFVIPAAAAAGCSNDNHQRPALRATLDEAQVTLAQSVDTALASEGTGTPVKAALLVGGDPVFQVGVFETIDQKDVRIHIVSGSVLSSAPTSPSTTPCTGSISLTAALGIAEERANGEAVAVVPDDDVACAFEIQVLAGSTLWEVKVGGDGAVLEYELSDEYGGSED